MSRSKQYADDLVAGTTHDLGSHTVTAEEIVAFASQWDPQDFHVDEEAARAGHFGGLIGSGLHSMAILQRLAVTGVLRDWALIAGRSISDVQMTSPLRPGMTVHGVLHIETVQHRGTERSLVHQRLRLEHGDTTVLSFRGAAYVRRRPASPATD